VKIAFCLALSLVGAVSVSSAGADEALIAVASNFAEPATVLKADFETSTGHALRLATGSTGTLYAQIVHGAPFHALLAADRVRPARLEAEGAGVRGSRFTYAIGHLVLWSPDPDRIGADGVATLRAGRFDHLAIAHPELAPYGRAARQTLQHFGLWEALAPRIARGQNVAQAFSMVATGSAPLGLVARASVMSPRNQRPGSRWDVPAEAHEPIRQDALLLEAGADHPAATDFLRFLRSADAHRVIERFGYGVE